jgi:hypothetical protein
MNNYDKYNYEFIKCVNTTHQTLVNMLSSSWSGVTYTKQYSDSTKKLGITKKLDYNSAFEISTIQCYAFFKSIEDTKNKCIDTHLETSITGPNNRQYHKCFLDTIEKDFTDSPQK